MIYGGILGTAIFFTLALILFLKWNIPKAIGNITGISVKKGIKKIKQDSQHNLTVGNNQNWRRDEILVKFVGDTLSLKEQEKISSADTTLLSEEEPIDDTIVLCEDRNQETTLLVEEPIQENQDKQNIIPEQGFESIANVIVYHTKENIEENE